MAAAVLQAPSRLFNFVLLYLYLALLVSPLNQPSYQIRIILWEDNYKIFHGFCLVEVRAMVVAVQQPSPECTATFTVCVLSNTAHSLSSNNTQNLLSSTMDRIPKQCPHQRPKVNVLATHQNTLILANRPRILHGFPWNLLSQVVYDIHFVCVTGWISV